MAMGKTDQTIGWRAWRERGAWFEHRALRLFYRDDGAGSVLLCLHGFPTSSWDWHRLWPQLVSQYRVIAPDFLGFGFSSKPKAFDYTIAAQADAICALLSALRIERVHLLVHDYGTIVAQELLARQQSGRSAVSVMSVCCLNGSLFPDLTRPRPIQRLLASPLGPALRYFVSQRIVCKNIRAVFGNARPPDAELLSGMWSIIKENAGQRRIPQLLQYIHQRWEHAERWGDAWKQAQIRRRLVVGDEDPVAGPHVVGAYRERVRGSDVYVIQGSGHYVMLEDPVETWRAITEFHALLG